MANSLSLEDVISRDSTVSTATDLVKSQQTSEEKSEDVSKAASIDIEPDIYSM